MLVEVDLVLGLTVVLHPDQLRDVLMAGQTLNRCVVIHLVIVILIKAIVMSLGTVVCLEPHHLVQMLWLLMRLLGRIDDGGQRLQTLDAGQREGLADERRLHEMAAQVGQGHHEDRQQVSGSCRPHCCCSDW